MEHSILFYKKSLNLFKELLKVTHLEGNTAEIGVFKGGTSRLIHAVLPTRTHYAYDTFCGIRGSNPVVDRHQNGEFCCDLSEVQHNIGMSGVVYKVGMFPETFNEQDVKFVFVHSDTDTYIGTKATLDYFAPLMVPGGKILFDDYQHEMCPAVEMAIHEFLETHNEDFEVTVFDNSYECEYDNTCINQCLLTKK